MKKEIDKTFGIVSLKKWLRRLESMLVRKSLKIVNLGLHFSGTIFTKGNSEDYLLPYPPIFLIGAPRSGSTLLYQVLTDYYDVGYLSNLHCKFYGSPHLVEKISHASIKDHQKQDYSSYHGQTQGWLSPSECGEFWYQFFRRHPPYVTLADVDESKMIFMKNFVGKLADAAQRPILFKNLYCSLRLGPISRYLPESVFIVITRNVLDNAHSILEGRKKALGVYDEWWSVEPPEVERLKLLLPHEQAVEQIYSIYDLISRNSNEIGQEKFLWISYEDLCSDARGTLKQISTFLSRNHIKLEQRIDINDLPSSFQKREEVRIDSELYAELVEYVESRQAKSKARLPG